MKRILRLPQVTDRTGRSKSWIYDAMKTGDFPPQIKLSKQAVGWLEADIDQWITERIKVNQADRRDCISKNREEMHA